MIVSIQCYIEWATQTRRGRRRKMRREALELCTKYTKYQANPSKRNAMQSKWSTAELALLLMLLNMKRCNKFQ